MKWRSARFAATLAMAIAAGCADEPGGPGEVPRIAALRVAAGSGQSAPIGSLLPAPLVVRVADQYDEPIQGAVINWAVTSGSGQVTPLSDTTDATGLAQTTFRLGSTLGVHTVSATLPGVAPVSFTATATAAPASELVPTAGDAQTALVGTKLPIDLEVRVTDAFDNPKPDIPVNFTVVAGGGSVSSPTVVSDANGRAKVSWTLGTVAGTQSLIAGSGSLPSYTFTATGTPDSPAAFVVVSGEDQIAAPGAPLPDSIVVRLVDQYGNGTAGHTVSWSVAAGAASPATTVTSGTGRTAVRWTIGPTGGQQLLAASAGPVAAQVRGAAFITFTAVSTGGRHSCGIGADGAVYCWGFNGDSELGLGTLPAGAGPIFSQPMAVASVGGQTFSQVSAGTGHTCAVTITGDAWCWGSNVDGRLGLGTHTSERFATPQAVNTTYSFDYIVSGRGHNCGLGFSPRPVCWGANHDGQVGVVAGGVITSTNATIDVPQSVISPVFDLGSVSISTGGVHSCSVAPATGAAHCWGNNVFGQLGTGTNTGATRPVAVASGGGYTAIAAGGYHTCAIQTGGAARCWGDNTHGQLGRGNTTGSNTPVNVIGGLTFTMLASGTHHTCGLTTGGAAYCWGRNSEGQLGDGSTTPRTSPVAVTGGFAFQQITAGEAQTCAITTANRVYCWGDNQFGALGDGTTGTRVTPTRVRFQP